MTKFIEISPKELNENSFKLIGKDWMLITAQNSHGDTNAMTASWGGLGVMWAKDVAYIVVRPQRYTKEFIDETNKFSLSFFTEEYRDKLKYFGTVSGRDEDKIVTSGLTLNYEDTTPYFNEANLSIFCKTLYKQEMKKECFIDEKLINLWYPNSDYHMLYIAEIEKILIKND